MVKDANYQVRVDRASLKLWRQAAKSAGVKLAEFIRQAVTEKATAR